MVVPVVLDDGPDAEAEVVAVLLHEVRRVGLHEHLDAAVGVLLDLRGVLGGDAAEELADLFVELLGEAEGEGLAEVLEQGVELDLVLEVLALLEDGDVGLGEDGELGVDLFLGGAGLGAEQLLEVVDLLAVLDGVGVEAALRGLDLLGEADEEGLVLPDEGELVLESPELVALQLHPALLENAEDLPVALALLGDVLDLPEDLLLDRAGLVVEQLAGLQQPRAPLADLLVEQPDADDQVGQLNELDELLGGAERDEGREGGAGDDALEGRSHLLLDLVLVLVDPGPVGDGPVLEEQVVVYLLVELAEALEVLGVLDLVVDDLVGVLPGGDGLVLRLGLLLQLGLEELGVVVWMAAGVLICMEMIFISRDSLAKIFLMAASLSSRISDSESLSSR